MNMKKSRSNTVRRILNDDKGVSPVIAVILMVAITVVMAAIVSSWSAGVNAPTTPTTVGLDIARNNDTIAIVVTAIDPASAAPISQINISYYNYSTPVGYNFATLNNSNVGDTLSFNTGSATLQQIIVTATYKDASKKVLYSRNT
jgi:flagellin-like protein